MSIKAIARITGLGYLIIFFTGFFSNFYMMESLVDPESISQTGKQIAQNIDLFRMGLLSFVIMILVDVLLAGSLYQLLKDGYKEIALFSSALRMVNGTIFAVALYSLFEVLNMSSGSQLLPESGLSELESSLEMFQYMWSMALIFFGVHLLFLGYLLVKSVRFPSIIGALLFIAGLAYLIDCFARIGYANYELYSTLFENLVVIPAVIGEFSFTLFLLIKGVKKNNVSISQTKDQPL